CKLDLDVDLPPRYFELLMERMEADPRLGTCSGKPYFRSRRGRLISEACGDENSVGMTKFYRTEAFRQIGWLVRVLMGGGIGGRPMLWGYIRSMARRRERYPDEEFRAFLRSYQMQCLLTGKARATRRLNQRQASAWAAPNGREPAPAAAAAMPL